ncbi:hypothetical protein RFI_23146 [Reticulomyxa filosa]|uniref:Secretory carrier-associated membrane protein n=1 Tax=Reticulomyxa filosa TaxID=46433 RepID=X6MMB3_RETFI|nr:hypothetical protein RFI_23146 [Reticulomyxa filosa]|eukprot:ETO14225.1 hypothetical protein RFI_23146 [Reticulomyxa filosa]
MTAYGTSQDNWGYEEADDKGNPYASPMTTQYSLVEEPSQKTNGTSKAYDAPSQPLIGSEGNEEKSQKLEELEERERRATILQQELDAREEKLRKSMGSNNFRPKKNWPHPSIGWARNAISVDIPKKHQNGVRKFYALWLLTAIAAVLNLLLCLWYGFSKEGSGDIGFMQWVLAICYVVVGGPKKK